MRYRNAPIFLSTQPGVLTMDDFGCPSHSPARPCEHAPSLSSDDIDNSRSFTSAVEEADSDYEELDLS